MLVLAFLAFVYLPPDRFFQRFVNASDASVATLNGRIPMAKAVPPLVRQNPLFGSGMGGFESAFYQVKDIFPGSSVDYAHNDYIQGIAELGLVGFGLLAIMFLVVGAAKLADLPGSHKAMVGFGVPAKLAGLFGALLPIGEIALCIALMPRALA
jgi:O-antigen ligase